MCFSFSFLSCPSSLPFSLSCLLLFLHLLPLVPVLVSSTSSSPFLFPCHLLFLLPWLRPLSLPSSLCLLLLCFPIPFSFCFFLLLFLSLSVSSSVVSSFGSVTFRPPPGFPPLPLLLVFDPLPLLFLLHFTLTLLSRCLPPVGFSSAHPLVCLSCSVVWPASIFLSSSSSLFLLFSGVFCFLFSLVGPCLVFLIACALVLSNGGGGFCYISVFLHSVLPSSLCLS